MILGCLLFVAGTAVARPPEGSLSPAEEIRRYRPPREAPSEYFDYIYVDSAARRVYLSHGTEVEVISADDGAVVGNITGFKRNHGIAIASEFGRGFITDGADGKVIHFRS